MKWFLDRVLNRSICFKGGDSSGSTRIITDDMKASAEVATQQWNDYQTRFVPFENKFIADANTRDETGRMQGMVNADLAQKTGAPTVNPNHAGVSANYGKALSAGVTDAAQSAQDRKSQMLGTAVAMGRGQQTEALTGLTDQAITSGTIASRQAIADNKLALAERGQTFGMIGSALGAAGGVAKNALSSTGPAISYSVAPDSTAGPTASNAVYNGLGSNAQNASALGLTNVLGGQSYANKYDTVWGD